MINQSGTQFWGKRKPMIKYFEHGWIIFKVTRKPKQLLYRTYYWLFPNRKDQDKPKIGEGVVRDKEHLKQLLSYELPNRN